MFKNFRKKMTAVLPDIENLYLSSGASMSTIYKNSMGSSSQSSFAMHNNNNYKSNWPPLVDFTAGCDILEHNENLWEKVHAANEDNAAKSMEVDEIINGLTDQINKRLIDLSDINVSLEAIPNLVKTVQNCSNVMHDVNKKCFEVEKQLVELENLIEVLQLQEKQLDSKFEMAMYKERKLGAFFLILYFEY